MENFLVKFSSFIRNYYTIIHYFKILYFSSDIANTIILKRNKKTIKTPIIPLQRGVRPSGEIYIATKKTEAPKIHSWEYLERKPPIGPVSSVRRLSTPFLF